MNSEDAVLNAEPAGSACGAHTFSPSADSAQAFAIDRSVLEQLNALVARGDAEPFAVRAARLYLRTSANLVAAMEAGFIAGDANAVCLAVHTLKSSSNSLGARALGRMAAELEALAYRGTLENQECRIEEISHEYRQACGELNAFIEESTRDVPA